MINYVPNGVPASDYRCHKFDKPCCGEKCMAWKTKTLPIEGFNPITIEEHRSLLHGFCGLMDVTL